MEPLASVDGQGAGADPPRDAERAGLVRRRGSRPRDRRPSRSRSGSRRRRPRRGSRRAPARRSPPARSSSSDRRRRRASARRRSRVPGGLPAAHQTARALGLALLDVGEHAFLLCAADLRPLEIRRALRVPVAPALEGLLDQRDGLVVPRSRNQPAGRDRAALPAVHAGHRGPRTDAAEIRVVEHDRRATSRRARGRPSSPSAAAHAITRRPVRVEPVKLTTSTRGIRGQDLADEMIRGRHDLDHARRNVGLLRDHLPQVGRRPGRVRGRLEDTGIARRQRRGRSS